MKRVQCPCTGETLDRFLRPTVMAVLAQSSQGLHGYSISRHLQNVAIFKGNPPDSTGLYRTLKDMENEGYLSSAWDVAGSGPAKRVYALTDAGRVCLRRWEGTLESYSRMVEETVNLVKQSLTKCTRRNGHVKKGATR